jgi:ubiquitin C-terminal hydrolase
MHLHPFLSSSQINDVGNYYSYIRPDIQTNKWYRFDDEFVTRVDFTDDIDDAYGGSCAALR